MATPEHLLKDWNGFERGAVLHSFNKPSSRDYSDNNSYTYTVADWRVEKPILNKEHCIDCQFCWIYCPDTSIISVDEKMSHVDYIHCKGCGICSQVCPTNPKSLIMFSDRTTEEHALSIWPAKEDKKAKEGAE